MIPYYLSQILFIGFSQLNLSSVFSLEIEPFDVTQKFLYLLIGVFSILLLLLSVSSYKKTGLKSILYAAAAFGLFSISIFIEALEQSYNVLGSILIDFLGALITLTILILFFLAIVKKNKWFFHIFLVMCYPSIYWLGSVNGSSTRFWDIFIKHEGNFYLVLYRWLFSISEFFFR